MHVRAKRIAWPEWLWERETITNVSGPEASNVAPWCADHQSYAIVWWDARARICAPGRLLGGHRPKRWSDNTYLLNQPPSALRHSMHMKRYKLVLLQSPEPKASCLSAGCPKGLREITGRGAQVLVMDSFCPVCRLEPLGNLPMPMGDCCTFLRCSRHAKLATG